MAESNAGTHHPERGLLRWGALVAAVLLVACSCAARNKVEGAAQEETPGGTAAPEVSQPSAGEAFGEMAVLDSAPRSASAAAEGEVELLRIGSEEFYEILHEQVEIAEGVIRMLTQRLRESTAQLSQDRAAPLSVL